jgi:hypothetical protein
MRSRQIRNQPRLRMFWGGLYTSVILALPLTTLAQLPPPPTVPDLSAPLSAYPPCVAPALGEYTLLVLSQGPEDQNRVRQLLPPTTPAQICNYQSLNPAAGVTNTGVIQVQGLTTVTAAQALGQRIIAATGLSVVVTQARAIAPRPASSTAYNPQPLGPGYAVLVDFASRPELALELTRQLQSIVGRAIALVSYNQRPYLLGAYIPDVATATALAQNLTGRGFSTQVVASSQVLVLRPAVALEP